MSLAGITPVGFGAWAVGGSDGPNGLGRVADDESIAAIRRAVEAGINWIDTAPAYGLGHSEDIVRRALEPYRIGEEVLVFTKCGVPWDGSRYVPDGRRATLHRECEQSLRRLGVERLDLLQLHWPDDETGTPVEETWGALAELVDEGKARWIGVCNFDDELLARCEAERHVDSMQTSLSLLVRGGLRSLAPWCERHGTAVLAYSPLATGLLSGSYDRARLQALPADDARARLWPDFQEPRLGRALALVDRLRPLAVELGTTLSALACAWVLAQPGVTGAIVGGRRPAYVDDWLAAVDLRLGEDLLATIAEAIAATGAGDDTLLPSPS
ncbi:MAG TPA: aldo/keto reductase [Solirubrobacteraceae bacterium]|nr:aldo/keto reductase [Solirubrobacteraceae bacterium]